MPRATLALMLTPRRTNCLTPPTLKVRLSTDGILTVAVVAETSVCSQAGTQRSRIAGVAIFAVLVFYDTSATDQFVSG